MANFTNNGFALIYEGIPGKEDTGDEIAGIADKLNKNFQLALSEQDDLAGKGLRQVGRKLEIDGLDPEVVEVDVSQESAVDLSALVANSALHIYNSSGTPKTLELNSPGGVERLTSFWVAFTGSSAVTLRFNGAQFLNNDLTTGDGEITLSDPSSLQMRKLNDIYWMVT